MTNDWGNGCVAACLGGLTNELHGYTLSGVYAFNSHIGIEANFDGHNGSPTVFSSPVTATSNGEVETEGQDFYTYTFGPKLTLPVGNFALFTHFLVGGAHGHESFTVKCLQSAGSESSCFTTSTSGAHGNGFAFKTGGGVDWNHGRLGVRILEVDYLHASTFVTELCGGCTQSDSFGITANNFELATGVTFNFGMK